MATTAADILDVINLIIGEIDTSYTSEPSTPYASQRKIINDVFSKTSPKDFNGIYLRLSVIDYYYTTNSRYSYFSLDDIAYKILGLGDPSAANDYFYKIATNRGKDTCNLFSSTYGIKKTGKEGTRMISLISKYAYFSLLQDKKAYPLGFPIYDSLSNEMCKKVIKALGGTATDFNFDSIEGHVAAHDELREIVFKGKGPILYKGYQQYDLLDAYLWRMGKIENGNLSLLLSKSDYIVFVLSIVSDYLRNNNWTKKITGMKSIKGIKCMKWELDDNVYINVIPNCKGLNPYMKKLMIHWNFL